MKDRLKQLRVCLHLTQQKFADRLKIKRGAITNYERGRNIPIDAVISLICREFSVSEEWLRTGKGEMFLPTPRPEFDTLIAKYPSISPEILILIEKIITLPKEQQDLIVDFIEETAVTFLSARRKTTAHHGQLHRRMEEDKTQAFEQEADAFASLAREQFLAEKKRESETSSVNESAEA